MKTKRKPAIVGKPPGRIGIIGGSGLYQIESLTRQKWVKVNTPFGPPSDELLTGESASVVAARVCFTELEQSA